ncbi:MAG: hypothetical protein ACK5N8_07365 [Alphaproteobacteria bacterium]
MNHEIIWDAVDNLAKKNNLSPSGLAKKAGLDSTTFNKSKRKRPDGKNRFPSLESIQKIIEACNVSFEEFYNLSKKKEKEVSPSNIPYIEFSSFNKDNSLIDAKEYGKKIRFPDNRNNLYAVEINQENSKYKIGTILVATKNSETRRGDNIIVRMKQGNIHLGNFVRRTAKTIEIIDLSVNNEEWSLKIDDIKEINRILWISQ